MSSSSLTPSLPISIVNNHQKIMMTSIPMNHSPSTIISSSSSPMNHSPSHSLVVNLNEIHSHPHPPTNTNNTLNNLNTINNTLNTSITTTTTTTMEHKLKKKKNDPTHESCQKSTLNRTHRSSYSLSNSHSTPKKSNHTNLVWNGKVNHTNTANNNVHYGSSSSTSSSSNSNNNSNSSNNQHSLVNGNANQSTHSFYSEKSVSQQQHNTNSFNSFNSVVMMGGYGQQQQQQQYLNNNNNNNGGNNSMRQKNGKQQRNGNSSGGGGGSSDRQLFNSSNTSLNNHHHSDRDRHGGNNHHHHHHHHHHSNHHHHGNTNNNVKRSKNSIYELLLICKSNRTIMNDQMHSNLPDTNIYSFFKHVTPECDVNLTNYKLKDLWSFYDEPYGVGIPIKLPKHSNVENVYFVPHLSAIKLVANNGNNTSRNNSSNNSSNSESLSCSSTSSLSSSPLQLPMLTCSTSPSSLIDDQAADLEQEKILFEFYETVTPDLRYPLIDKIEELTRDCPFLMEGTIGELNLDKSWFSIAWYPILCHNHTMNWLKGQMITYHKLSPSCHVIDTSIMCSVKAKTEFDELINEKKLKSSEHGFYAPIIGFLPYKLRNETWFYDFKRGNNQLVAPLYLLQASHRLQRFTNPTTIHPDYHHCLKNSPELGLIPHFHSSQHAPSTNVNQNNHHNQSSTNNEE